MACRARRRTPAGHWLALGAATLTLGLGLLPGSASAQASGGHGLQDPATIVAQVQTLLEERAASYPGAVSISVDTPRISNQAACSQLDVFLAGSGGLRSRTSVGVRCLAPQPWTLYVQASIQIIGPYYVASHALNRGVVIGQDDLDLRDGDLLRLRRVISDPAQVVGWITTRYINAGGAIESNALRDPNAIQRGQQVRTVARGAGFVVSGEGQAMESGNPGTQIQVRTPNGQIISGTVMDAYTVQVMM
ncbi:flagellar basal body P-ring formation chaperone FlgA [Castellaniella sp.]|uniref:flagellar basal body P-ring formation chaperone FlgA n=1 Tax=Castellaniella sp. TaxID=1955812 RepID=UPI002AFEDB7E|nr:flagellar basal body P-ring formation chaperone FlgA [Castellaniella sp.]